MQRVLRHTVLARNQALKRERRHAKKQVKDEASNIRYNKVLFARSQSAIVKAERANRREDWLLGPLAPNRLAGKDGGSYGMLSYQSVQLPDVLKSEREEYFNFAEGDRVVVVVGRERGKIGRIGRVDKKKQAVDLLDMNLVDVKVPDSMKQQSSSKAPYQAFPMPLRIQDVRLVVPLRDNATGRIKDIVVEDLRGGTPLVDPGYGQDTPRHTRFIGGLGVRIPWPESKVTKFEYRAADTRRIDVEPTTFSPKLNEWVLPGSAIDELRNKYSEHRIRHTQDYVQQKMKEDAEEQWKKRRRMLLPQQEYWEQKSKQKETEGQPRLSMKTKRLIKEMSIANLHKSGERIAGTGSITGTAF